MPSIVPYAATADPRRSLLAAAPYSACSTSSARSSSGGLGAELVDQPPDPFGDAARRSGPVQPARACGEAVVVVELAVPAAALGHAVRDAQEGVAGVQLEALAGVGRRPRRRRGASAARATSRTSPSGRSSSGSGCPAEARVQRTPSVGGHQLAVEQGEEAGLRPGSVPSPGPPAATSARAAASAASVASSSRSRLRRSRTSATSYPSRASSRSQGRARPITTAASGPLPWTSPSDEAPAAVAGREQVVEVAAGPALVERLVDEGAAHAGDLGDRAGQQAALQDPADGGLAGVLAGRADGEGDAAAEVLDEPGDLVGEAGQPGPADDEGAQRRGRPRLSRYASAAPRRVAGRRRLAGPGHGDGPRCAPSRAAAAGPSPGSGAAPRCGSRCRARRGRGGAWPGRRCRDPPVGGAPVGLPSSSSSQTAHQSARRGTSSCPASAATRSSSSCPASRSEASARKERAPRLSQSWSCGDAARRRGRGSRRRAARAAGPASPAVPRLREPSTAPACRGARRRGSRAQTVLTPVRYVMPQASESAATRRRPRPYSGVSCGRVGCGRCGPRGRGGGRRPR